MTLHIVITAFSIATALASGFAAWFWFKSSLQDPEIVEETQAIWSGIAVALGAATASLSAL
jgi:hypothetical protein